MARSIRQSKILELINENEIETQDELKDLLTKHGFSTTQATVSRDIKELGLIKVNGFKKKYKYAYIDHSEQRINSRMVNLFKELVISIKSAQNLVVVKTLSGNGSSAGMTVDKLNLSEVVGSVAGDDTLLIITETTEKALKVVETLKELLV